MIGPRPAGAKRRPKDTEAEITAWLLVETLGAPGTWSLVAVGTAPRKWKSLVRAVPGPALPVIAAAHASGEPVERILPKSRHAWSQQRVRAVPVVGPDDRGYAVHIRVGEGDTAPTPAAPYLYTNDDRRLEVVSAGLGPDFDRGRSVWTGAETYEHVERFDDALDWVATMAQSEPGARWLGEMTVRTPGGLRTLMTAARSDDANPGRWRGLLVDITDSVPPQPKSFEAATVDTLINANPGLYLAVVDTEQVRVLRWISGPIPGLLWSGDVEERTLPHPDDLDRIREARKDVRAGKLNRTLSGLRLAGTDGGWLRVDAEISPLPHGAPEDGPPRFALVRFEVY
ncbi:GAF domain-containing protein [Nocardia vaccinii]|uniref:GAF domain-containing protein n=1 Tax=Nocardia vaccinii TaxID=1822 RepID=UPI000A6344DF|nr:GAF domain-containing protein [Nocardia vaccinii]